MQTIISPDSVTTEECYTHSLNINDIITALKLKFTLKCRHKHPQTHAKINSGAWQVNTVKMAVRGDPVT